MKRSALICSALLACTSISLAATPDELWQNYQGHPSNVSTVPVKPAEETDSNPKITIEAANGSIVTPTAGTAADKTANNISGAKEENPDTATSNISTETAHTAIDADNAGETKTDAGTAADTAAKDITNKKADTAADSKTSNTVTASAPVVSNKPTPATKPKPSLVGKPPLSKQFLRTPQENDFTAVTNAIGGYSLAIPKSFGSDPLAQLPSAEGSMLVRTTSSTLMLAATVLDIGDTTSYKSSEPLPAYADAKLYCDWQHPSTLNWTCRLARNRDYHGDVLLLQAQAQAAGKTYQLLFVMPKDKQSTYLPQTLYSLHSFKLL